MLALNLLHEVGSDLFGIQQLIPKAIKEEEEVKYLKPHSLLSTASLHDANTCSTHNEQCTPPICPYLTGHSASFLGVGYFVHKMQNKITPTLCHYCRYYKDYCTGHWILHQETHVSTIIEAFTVFMYSVIWTDL